MEKEHQPESMATVTIKPDYPPSEVYGSEPPPAYHKPQSSSVTVAKIIAVTVVLVSLVLGSFILASAYVSANASCKQLEQELRLLQETTDFRGQPLQPEALIQDEPTSNNLKSDSLAAEQSEKKINQVENNNIDNTDDAENISDTSDSDSDEEERTPIQFKLPLQLNFDDLAGSLIEKGQKSRMNCIVEKKRAEEVVDHQPKTLQLPYGFNLTTDPRLERVTGERMVIICESGNMQRHTPQSQEDDDEETIMIQPVMIPIPPSHFQTHMPQQMQPQQQIHREIHIHPMEAMRPPMPPMMRPQMFQFEQQQQQQQQQPQQQPQQQQENQLPPTQILHQIAQQIITRKIMEAQRAREEQIAREHQLAREQQMTRDQRPEVQIRMERIPIQQLQREIPLPNDMIAQRIPIPEEVLTELNRLPNRDMVIAVREEESEEEPQERDQEPQDIRMMPQHREPVPEVNNRQAFARGLPIDIPVPLMQHIQVQQEEEPEQPEQKQPLVQEVQQVTVSEENRPHYVQPRSVRSIRSVDALMPKRVKRCDCNCAC